METLYGASQHLLADTVINVYEIRRMAFRLCIGLSGGID
jgi:hypothetical protein